MRRLGCWQHTSLSARMPASTLAIIRLSSSPNPRSPRRVHMHRREQRRSPWVLCLPLGGDQTPRGGAVQQDLRDRQGGSHTYLQSFRGPLAKDHMEEVVKHVSVSYHPIKSLLKPCEKIRQTTGHHCYCWAVQNGKIISFKPIGWKECR